MRTDSNSQAIMNNVPSRHCFDQLEGILVHQDASHSQFTIPSAFRALGLVLVAMALSGLVFCVIAIVNGEAIGSPCELLFGYLFVAGTLALLFALGYVLLFGHIRLRLSSEGLEYEWRALFPLDQKHFPLHQVKRAVICVSSTTSDEGYLPRTLVEIITVGEPIVLSWLSSQIDLRAFVATFNEELSRIQSSQGINRTAHALDLRPSANCETLRIPLPSAPPGDSNILIDQDNAYVQFSWRGVMTPSRTVVYGLVFLAAIGLLGTVIIAILVNPSWIGLSAGVLFFGGGAAFLVYSLVALTAPCWNETWTMTDQFMERQLRCCGLRFAKRIALNGPLHVRPLLTPLGLPCALAMPPFWRRRSTCALGVVAEGGEEVFRIKGLTEGEVHLLTSIIGRKKPFVNIEVKADGIEVHMVPRPVRPADYRVDVTSLGDQSQFSYDRSNRWFCIGGVLLFAVVAMASLTVVSEAGMCAGFVFVGFGVILLYFIVYCTF
jgi:hypothetical protein